MSKVEELQHLSLATTYELDNDFDSEKFIKMRLRVAHDGVNPNYSNFQVIDMEKAKDSIKNIPILANVLFDEDDQPQFGSHDMEIEPHKMKDGDYKLIYKETPIGVVPSECNHTIEEFNGKNYVYCDGYIWRNYSNYAEDIIERDKDIKLSMEILVDEYSYNAKEKVYNINDYRYQGITFLNKNSGTGMKDALATVENFEENLIKEKFILMMEELKETLINHNKSIIQEGGSKVNKDILTLPSIENITLEEIESKIKEHFELLASDKRDEIINALSKEKYIEEDEYETEEYPRYYYINHNSAEIFACDYMENWCLYGFTYSMDGDSVVIDFESKKRKKFQIVDFEEGMSAEFEMFPNVKTEYEVKKLEKKFISEKKEFETKLDAMTSEYEKVKNEYEKLKSETMSKERQEAEEIMFGQFDEKLKGVEEYEQLKENAANFELDALGKECYVILGKRNANFSAKTNKKDKVKIDFAKYQEKVTDEYSELFEKYLKY